MWNKTLVPIFEIFILILLIFLGIGIVFLFGLGNIEEVHPEPIEGISIEQSAELIDEFNSRRNDSLYSQPQN